MAYHVARGPEFVPCTLLPQRSADAREGLEGWAQLRPGLSPTPGAAQELAEQELRPRAVERCAGGLMEQERFLEVALCVSVCRDERSAALNQGGAHDAPVSAVQRWRSVRRARATSPRPARVAASTASAAPIRRGSPIHGRAQIDSKRSDASGRPRLRSR